MKKILASLILIFPFVTWLVFCFISFPCFIGTLLFIGILILVAAMDWAQRELFK